jgi:hypothetical protein
MGFRWTSVVNPDLSIYCTYEGFAPVADRLMNASVLDEEDALPVMPAELAALAEAVSADEDERRHDDAYFMLFSARSPHVGKIPAWKIVHAEPAGFDQEETLLLAQALAPLAVSAPSTSFIVAFHTFLLNCAQLKGGIRKH